MSRAHEEAQESRPALPLPDRPAIAVLPFVNLSGDPEQEYFSDGISEDIIAALSKLRWFFVIARNSSFTFKGKAVHMKQVAEDLGVGYVVEGSVRKSGERVRITAQLNDVATGSHIWAERYDRDIADVFAVQDEITEAIVAAIEPQLYAAENFRAQRKPPESLDAWDLVMRGLSHYWRLTRQDNMPSVPIWAGLKCQSRCQSPNAPPLRRSAPTAKTLGPTMRWATFTCSRVVSMIRLPNSKRHFASIRIFPWRNATTASRFATVAAGRTAIWRRAARCG
jgi:TolB-like protein